MQTTLKATLVAAVIAWPLARFWPLSRPRPPKRRRRAASGIVQISGCRDDCEQNLGTFDTLDFDVYTHQKWDRLHESHAPDILVQG